MFDIKKYRKEYYKKHKPKILKRAMERYLKDKKKWHERGYTWRKKNPVKASAIYKKWYRSNPYYIKARSHRDKTGLPMTPEIVQRVYEDNIKKYGTLTCYLCLKSIRFGEDCLEHNIPYSRGGTNAYENLGVSHGSCNHKKRSKTYEEFKAKELGNS